MSHVLTVAVRYRIDELLQARTHQSGRHNGMAEQAGYDPKAPRLHRHIYLLWTPHDMHRLQ